MFARRNPPRRLKALQRGFVRVGMKRAALGGGRTDPRRLLFPAGEQGSWNDQTDFKAYMATGPELAANGGFDLDADWSKNAGWTITGGRAQFETLGSAASIFQAPPLVEARVYLAEFDIVAITAGAAFVRLLGASNVDSVSSATLGRYRTVLVAPAAPTGVAIRAASTTTGLVVDNFSIKELPNIGNASMFEDSAGTTALRFLGVPAGLILDLRLRLALGAELVPTNNLNGFSASGAAASVNDTTITTSGATSGATKALLTVGKVYRVTIAGNATTGVTLNTADAVTPTARTQVATGFGSFTFCADRPVFYIRLDAIGSATVTGLSLKEVLGNHRTQSTAASRPVPSGRVNVATNTEFVLGAVGAVPTDYVERGVVTGRKTADASTSSGFCMRVSCNGAGNMGSTDDVRLASIVGILLVGATYTVRLRMKRATAGVATTARVLFGGAAVQDFVLTDAYEWYSFPSNAGATGHSVFFGGSNGTLYDVAAVDVRLSADAALNIPAYQRVNSPTDYDTVGFPIGEDYDGFDDSTSSPTGGGGITGFFFCAALRVAGGAGTIRDLWSDEGANAGHTVRLQTTNNLALQVGTGATYTTVVSAATLPVGETHVVTAWHDGTAICVQVDNGAIASTPVAAAAAGSSGFVIGKNNTAAARFLPGRLFSPIHRFGAPVTTASRERIKRLVAAKAGMVL
jgi:hypothetical protein